MHDEGNSKERLFNYVFFFLTTSWLFNHSGHLLVPVKRSMPSCVSSGFIWKDKGKSPLVAMQPVCFLLIWLTGPSLIVSTCSLALEWVWGCAACFAFCLVVKNLHQRLCTVSSSNSLMEMLFNSRSATFSLGLLLLSFHLCLYQYSFYFDLCYRRTSTGFKLSRDTVHSVTL